MYKRILIVAFTLIGLSAILTFLPIHGESELYESVLRLHVIANSDSEEDQTLKLKVRDAILKETSDLFANCKDRGEAERAVAENGERIAEIARGVVLLEGYPYDVSVELGEERYPTRNYESFCFPSGEYLSLRVTIGEGEGENWWCVLFPPLCLGAASEGDGAISVGLGVDQYKIITERDDARYKVRFKLLEAIEEALK